MPVAAAASANERFFSRRRSRRRLRGRHVMLSITAICPDRREYPGIGVRAKSAAGARRRHQCHRGLQLEKRFRPNRGHRPRFRCGLRCAGPPARQQAAHVGPATARRPFAARPRRRRPDFNLHDPGAGFLAASGMGSGACVAATVSPYSPGPPDRETATALRQAPRRKFDALTAVPVLFCSDHRRGWEDQVAGSTAGRRPRWRRRAADAAFPERHLSLAAGRRGSAPTRRTAGPGGPHA